jgi:uncharacterized protein YndB with AHSA1/START domain
MPAKKDPSGRRYVEAQCEVPGTPEEVWRAIATGPGISAWFVPSTVDGRVDGVATCNFGPGMEAVAKIKLWDPPRRYVAESEEGAGAVATEWIVEARAGGTCIVRVVHSWFADTDEWDNQFDGHVEGWKSFFRNLRIYLTHFRGEPSSGILLTGLSTASKEAAWEAMIGSLGFARPAVGQKVTTGSSSPLLAGVVERVGEPSHPEELLLRLDQPAKGIAHLFAFSMGPQEAAAMGHEHGVVVASARLYLYGNGASAVATEVEPDWQAWVNRLFPAPGAPHTA